MFPAVALRGHQLLCDQNQHLCKRSLDDSFVLRYASGELKLKKLKDSAHNRYAHGFNVVLLIWTNGTIRIPVGFRLFLAQPGEASKICLALELRQEARVARQVLSHEQEARMIGLQPKYVLSDSWYSSESILNLVDQTGWLFVTQLRKNRLLDAVPVNSDRRPYWVKVGALNKVRCAARVVRHGKRYLVSNDLESRQRLTRLLMVSMIWCGAGVLGPSNASLQSTLRTWFAKFFCSSCSRAALN